MTIQNLQLSSPVAYVLAEYLATNGISIETGMDFDAYQNAVLEQKERGPVGPRFLPSSFRSSDEQAFWLIGRDTAGEIVHTHAMRLIDLEGNSLAAHLERSIGDYISDIVDYEQLQYRPGPGTQAVTGTACYAGEFWMKGGENGIRGKDLTTPLSNLMMAMILMRWSPAFIFAVIRTAAICKGLAARAHFLHTEPGSIIAPLIDDDAVVEGWIAWTGREELNYLLKLALKKWMVARPATEDVLQKSKVA